jgi:hypothetical protein
MVDMSKVISPKFLQHKDSCVLASYAIAARYFTNIPIDDFFFAYCRHYNLPYKNTNVINAQDQYDSHFHHNMPEKSGYEKIEILHNSSNEPEFLRARTLFSVRIFQPRLLSDISTIDNELRTKEAIFNLTIEISSNCHSITAAINQADSQYFYVNTAPHVPLNFLYSGNVPIRDGMLSIKI